VKKPKNASI